MKGMGEMAAGNVNDSSREAEDLWYPRPDDLARSNVARLVRELGLADYDALYRFSIERPGEYWRAVNRFCGMVWSEDFTSFVDLSRGKEFPKWFVGGALNWTDTVFARADDPACAKRAAVISETESGEVTSLTYAELHQRVRNFAAGLLALKIGKGDRVGMLMEPGIEATITLLSIVYVGAVFVPLYSGFGVDPIMARLSSVGARALIATTGFKRRGKHVATTEIALEVRKRLAFEVLVMKRSAGEPLVADALDWGQVAATEAASALRSARTLPHDPFMVIHTSGTTGLPKGTVHTHGGFPMKIAHDSLLHFDVRAGEVLFWPADMGWIAGALVVASALIHRATMVCYDGAPDFPDWSRMSKIIERHKVTHFACGPTMIRGFAANEAIALEGDTLSIRVLITGGEPIDPEHFVWHWHHFGDGTAPLINYSGGSEVSGSIVSSVVVKPIPPAGFNTASPGMAVDVVDAAGKSIRGEIGELAILEPFIGMTQSFWEDDERYLDAYWRTWPGKWIHGDLAIQTEAGGFLLRGRSDDTIKVAGKRLGPAEIEEVLLELPGITEAAAIGVDDPTKGQMLVVFIVTTGKIDERSLAKVISGHVETRLGKLYRPGRIHVVRQLPKTRNGKVMRRAIRSAYCGLPAGDLSSLDDRSTLDGISKLAGASSSAVAGSA
jgi:acetyl-CoA synthetase